MLQAIISGYGTIWQKGAHTRTHTRATYCAFAAAAASLREHSPIAVSSLSIRCAATSSPPANNQEHYITFGIFAQECFQKNIKAGGISRLLLWAMCKKKKKSCCQDAPESAWLLVDSDVSFVSFDFCPVRSISPRVKPPSVFMEQISPATIFPR